MSGYEQADHHAKLTLLDQAIEKHPAFRPAFLRKAMGAPWSVSEAAIIIPEYIAFIQCFPGCLARLVGLVADDESRAFLGSILHEELGAGRQDQIHHRLFATVVRSSRSLPSDISDRHELFPATLNLIAEMRHLYGHNDILVALGAQYALEKQALGMIQGIAAGLSNVLNSHADYFELHLRQEPEHHEKMKQCILRYLNGPEDVSRAISGARALLEALDGYWTSLAERSDGSASAKVVGEHNPVLAFENNLLTAVVNRLSPQPGSKVSDLPNVETASIDSAGAWVSMVYELLGHFAKAINPRFRVYIAAINDDASTHTIVMARSASGNDWQLGVVAESSSNIAFVHNEKTMNVLDDIRRIGPTDSNQEIDEERAVANVPIIYLNSEGSAQCLAVLGISSPLANTLDEDLIMFVQRFATNLGVLIRMHLDARRGLRKRIDTFRKMLFKHMLVRLQADEKNGTRDNPSWHHKHQRKRKMRTSEVG